MRQGRKSRLVYMILSLIGLFVLIADSFTILGEQYKCLNQELSRFIYESLSSCTESAGQSAEQERIQIHLDQFNKRNNDYQIYYQKVPKPLERQMPQVYEQLLNGNSSLCNGNGDIISSSLASINQGSLVSIIRSSDVLIQTEVIFNSLYRTGALLVILTLGICIALGLGIIRQKQMLQMKEERYAVLFQFSDTILFEYDYVSDTVEFTPNAANKLKLDGLTITGVIKRGRGSHLIHPDDWKDGEGLQMAWKAWGKDEMLRCRIRLKTVQGEYRWFNCQFKILKDSSGRQFRVVGKLEDIMEQLGREERLKNEARRDLLTGMYNRFGKRIIDKELASRKKGLFIMIDLDNFKEINDTYGHVAGDTALICVAGDLKRLFGETGVVARMGGDEFVVFLPEEWDTGRIETAAKAIIDAFRNIESEEFPEIKISASIGIAVAPKDGITYGELYHAADKAMYWVKNNSKKGYAFYQDSQ